MLKNHRQEEIEKGRDGNRSAKESIRGKDGREKAARNLRDEIAPEERRVDGALHRCTPVIINIDALIDALDERVMMFRVM